MQVSLGVLGITSNPIGHESMIFVLITNHPLSNTDTNYYRCRHVSVVSVSVLQRSGDVLCNIKSGKGKKEFNRNFITSIPPLGTKTF